MEPYVPHTADVVWLTLHPALGHEQRGRRTFLVLTPRSYNSKTSLVVGCPITSKEKGYPFEIPVRGNQAFTGVILSDQVKSLDWRIRKAELITAVDAATVTKVRVYIKTLLGM